MNWHEAGGILALLAVIIGYIGYLRGLINHHENTIANLQAEKEQKDALDKILGQISKVQETERDYEKLKDTVNNDTNSDASKPSTS